MNGNTVLARNPELLAVDMDGETVMMDMESGNYFGINAVGSHIWELLEDKSSVGAIIESVKESFDLRGEDTVQDDVLAFLLDMKEQKLLEVING